MLTGNADVDEIARAGLRGLSDTLFFRTSVEPALPTGVDLETDELAFFPMLYWPVTPDQPRPSAEAYGKLNDYLRSGGLILFDTRDADIAGFGAASPNGRKLQELAAPLDIPPLEPLPGDHVLTRTFYLLQDFPGRYTSRDVWVEAAPPDAEQIEGMPFRNLNDGVTPVVIGGNDWAAAWAVRRDWRTLAAHRARLCRGTAARAGLPLWREPGDACADRQLQIRSGPCACAAGSAGPMTGTVIFDPLIPLVLLIRWGVIALPRCSLASGAGCTAGRLRGAGSAGGAGRIGAPVLPDRGPRAAERHRVAARR